MIAELAGIALAAYGQREQARARGRAAAAGQAPSIASTVSPWTLDQRADFSGWTVATGGSSARGGDRTQREDASYVAPSGAGPGAGYAPDPAGGTLLAGMGGGMDSGQLLMLAGAALVIVAVAKKKG